MRTSLGNLPITVDPVTGRARVVRGGTERRAAQAERPSLRDSRRGPTDGSVGLVIGKPETALAPPFDSQLEADRANCLYGLQLAGEVRQYIYHPLPFPIGTNMIYTPDFMVWWADYSITIEEIKGSAKMKNARDGITRLKVAACLYPMHHWQLITRAGREWRIRRIV